MTIKWKLKFIYRALFNSKRWKVIIFDMDNLSDNDKAIIKHFKRTGLNLDILKRTKK